MIGFNSCNQTHSVINFTFPSIHPFNLTKQFKLFKFSKPFSISFSNHFSRLFPVMNSSNLSVPQSSSTTLGIPPSTPAHELRTRSPQQTSPGFVLTGSDSRRRNTKPSSCPTSPTPTATSTSATGPASKKRSHDDDDDGSQEAEQSASKQKKKKPKVSPYLRLGIYFISRIPNFLIVYLLVTL